MLLVKVTKEDIKEMAEVLGTCECGAPAQIAFLGQSKFICLDCDDKNDTGRKID
jgi:hypothetical protein